MKVILKCAQAIGLIAATLLLPAIPSQAQLTINNPIPPSTFNTTPKVKLQVTPKPGLITFINKGAYVAQYTVSYDLNGKQQFHQELAVAVGQKRSVTIPVEARNVRATGAQLVWMVIHGEVRNIFNHPFPIPPSNVCFTTSGLMGNAKFETSYQPTCHL